MVNGRYLRVLAFGLAAALLLLGAPGKGASQARAAGQPVATVCLDAGHGGLDNGARAGQLLEKDLSLAICRRIKAELEERGYQVFLTRVGDFAIPIEDRAGVANHRRAEAFVSIHADSGFAEAARGPRIYSFAEAVAPARKPGALQSAIWRRVPAGARAEGARLARSIAAGLEEAKNPAAVVREAPLLVLAGARMPAVLVEVGALPLEAAELARPETQDRLAGAIAQGIDHFFRPAEPPGAPVTGPPSRWPASAPPEGHPGEGP
jgi:N-acetylmuramoyl-L-alanine amidase